MAKMDNRFVSKRQRKNFSIVIFCSLIKILMKQHVSGAYTGPGPRPGTGRHRYMFLIYQSDVQVKEDRKFDSIPERRKFPMAKFVENNHLTLIYQTLFTVDA